jgi:hypothetical protein
MEKVAQTLRLLLYFFRINHPISENSPDLVTLEAVRKIRHLIKIGHNILCLCKYFDSFFQISNIFGLFFAHWSLHFVHSDINWVICCQTYVSDHTGFVTSWIRICHCTFRSRLLKESLSYILLLFFSKAAIQ